MTSGIGNSITNPASTAYQTGGAGQAAAPTKAQKAEPGQVAYTTPDAAKAAAGKGSSTALAPRGPAGADPGAALPKFAELQGNLDTLYSGNTLDLLARLMVEQAGQQRKSALDDRLAARQQAKNDLLDQAGKLKEQANTMASGALTSLILTVVTASLSAIGGAMAAGGGLKSGAAQSAKFKEALAGGETTKVALKLGGQAGLVSGKVGQAGETLSQVSNQIGQGSTRFNDAKTESDTKRQEAAGQESAARAQEQQASGDVRKEQQQALDEMVKSIIQFLKDMQEAQAEHMRALTRV